MVITEYMRVQQENGRSPVTHKYHVKVLLAAGQCG